LSMSRSLRLAIALALPLASSALRVGTPALRSCAPIVAPVTPPPPFTASSEPARLNGEAFALLAGAVLLSSVEPASAAAAPWIAPTKLVLSPLLSIGTIFFLLRVVLSWFPTYDLKEPPWNIVAIPTEPLLKPTRKLIPPVAGVDISPIVWVSLLSFFSEILCGPQGILTIMQKRG